MYQAFLPLIGDRRDFTTIRGVVPSVQQVLPVFNGPSEQDLFFGLRKIPSQDTQIADIDRNIVLPIPSMEVRGVVSQVVHPDGYPIDVTQPRHTPP